MAELADPRGSQAVLIGAAAYRHLDPLPAVEENLAGLAELLTNTDRWGLPPGNCHRVFDVTDPSVVGRTVRAAAAATAVDGLLIVYYAGHGLVNQSDGSLVLALPECEPEFPDEAGLPYDRIGRAVRSSAARRRIVILDCCYAGRAGVEMTGQITAAGVVADKAELDETCLLVAARRNRPAFAPAGETYTAFTGELLRVLRYGMREAGPLLTVHTVWREIGRSLKALGRELPELRERNSGSSLPLVRNAAIDNRDLAGTILVAARGITDPDLHETAVLILRHNETGAVGVRLTRPMETLSGEFAGWRPLLGDPVVIFDGGPVARDGYIAVGLLRPNTDAPLRFTPLRDRLRLGTVSLSAPPEEVRHTFNGIRIFSGYLGWGPGELEAHVERESLLRTDHAASAVFSSRPARELWPSPDHNHHGGPVRDA